MQSVISKPPIADRVRDARASAGLTVDALGKRANLPVHTIHGIEQGRVQRPRAKTIGRLAAALGCTIAFLEGREPISVNGSARREGHDENQ